MSPVIPGRLTVQLRIDGLTNGAVKVDFEGDMKAVAEVLILLQGVGRAFDAPSDRAVFAPRDPL